MIENFKEFTFEAAHKLSPDPGVHGHSFTVQVVFVGDPDPVYGWVVSLNDLDQPISKIQCELDEKYLNGVVGLEVPTLENIAQWIFNRLETVAPSTERVTVSCGSGRRSAGCVYSRQPR